ncbi:hypothetical protein [Odoribacter lunatus]|uniref:hypothetical protein n=1 Tax=Odoribacter lunatus TaxID=2941335 RepID=UPI002041227A|nr:hypothetical protein [Odoribacter lunatus]
MLRKILRKHITCGIVLFFLLGGEIRLYADDYVKYVRQMYPVKPQTNCLVDLKFAQVILKQWERDSILLEASFRIKEVEEWEKETLAEQLNFCLRSWADIWKLHLELAPEFNRGGDLVAEIKIWVPRDITLDIINRYGTINLPDYDARLPLSLTTVYGNINVDTVRSLPQTEIRLNVSYGKLEIKNCEKATIRSAYSSVGVKTARYLQIKAEKSTLRLQNTDTIISQGEYNHYDIDSPNPPTF